jgi:hypothetical protein
MTSLRTTLVLLSVIIAGFGGCGRPKPADEIGVGTRSGNTYSHEHFNFKITFPADWYVMSQQEQAELMNVGQQVAAGDNEQLKAAARSGAAQMLNLVAAFRHPPGSVVDSNMNIIISAERVSHVPGVKRGADYLGHTRKMLTQTALQPRTDPIESAKAVGPLEMDVLPVHINMGVQEVHQRMHAARIGDYVLLIATTYTTDEERAQLDAILQSITPAKGPPPAQ